MLQCGEHKRKTYPRGRTVRLTIYAYIAVSVYLRRKERHMADWVDLKKAFQNITGDKKYILWGAGAEGIAFEKKYGDRINIKYFADSDTAKQGSRINGREVKSPHALAEKKGDTVVIISTAGYFKVIEERLISYGYEHYTDYVYNSEFIPIFEKNQNDKIALWHVNQHITDFCTLRCKDCSVFIPYIENPEKTSLEKVKRDADLLFEKVDFVQEYHIIGGEPMLHAELAEIVAYIGGKYREKIECFAIATNGTILAKEALLKVCTEHNVTFVVSDYENSHSFNKESKAKLLHRQLTERGIACAYADKIRWYDFGNPKETNFKLNESELKNRFSECRSLNRILHDGKLYYCHHQFGGLLANLTPSEKGECIDLETAEKQEILEFGLGHTHKAYLEFCNRCRGYDGINTDFIPSAEQL